MGDPSMAAPPTPMGRGEAPMDPAMAGQMSPPAEMPQEMGMGQEPPIEEYEEEDSSTKWLDFALSQANLAKKLHSTAKGKEKLQKIGSEVVRGYKEDEQSREDWVRNNKEWLDLALLVRKNKTFPWPKASNVKYPLVATAAMQFSARAFPSLVPADGKIVKGSVKQGKTNAKLYDAAKRIGHHMSFQIMNKIPRWQEDMDKLLMSIAVSGICFKKTYYDTCAKENRSYLVYPENLVINYFAKDLESAYRITEITPYNSNEVREKVLNDEEFLDVLKEEAAFVEEETKTPVANKLQQPSVDKSTPHVFLQQSTYLDLDDDGYEEPYVITVHKNSGKVVRIVARWDSDGVYRNTDGKIYKIQPVHYYTDFPFIPNPDGSIYALGFGTLLGPLNISINTLTNLLIDSGVMNNLQAGFIGKGLRIQMGDTALRPGQWKVVNASGDDLQKSVFPMPSKEPSAVLFQLINLLIQSGNQLASIAEIFVGKMPGQNTPATTTQETVQQSMAVFTAIYKRVYRSMDAEFKKMYRLNSLNPEMVAEETKLAGIPLEESDYENPIWVICPAADPSGDSSAMRLQKMQGAGQLLQFGHINVGEFSKMMLELMELPDFERLIQAPPPAQPDPKAQAMQAKAQLDQQKGQQDAQAKEQDAAIKQRLADLEEQKKVLELRVAQAKAELELSSQERSGQMDMIDNVSKQRFNEQERAAERVHARIMEEIKQTKERQKSTKKGN